MNLPGRALLCSLLVPVFGSSPGEQRIRFAPKEDTRLEKGVEMDFDFALDEFSLVVDGEDVGSMMGGFDLSMLLSEHAVVTDRYVKVGEGRPTELLRTFDELGGTFSMSVMSEFGSHDQDLECSSELEGSTVRFLWDPDGAKYRITYENGETAALLEKLDEDLDCRVLLPKEEVAEGATWEVPLGELTSIACPGGELAILPEGTDMAELGDYQEFGELFAEKFASLTEQLEGRCVCTYTGPSSEDPELAEIALAIEVTANLDLSDAIFEVIDAVINELGEDEMPEFTIDTADFSFELEGEGLLVWNVAEDRLVSLDVDGDVVLSLDFAASVAVEGERHGAELFMEMTGSMQQSRQVTE
jgi:hypothetical protein